MPKPLPSDSEGEDANVSEESSPVAAIQGVPQYEMQRLSRIAENMKRMEALGLHKMAKSLMKGSTCRSTAKGKYDKGKRKINQDEDYNPNSEDELDGEDTENDYVNEDIDAPGLARKKGKSTSKSKKKKTTGKKLHVDPDFVGGGDDDDDELMQAIALSLQDSVASPGKRNAESTIQRTKDMATDSTRGKKKKQFTSRVTMTEDDMVMHFFQLDDAGKGAINVRDLERVALSHDFIWSDKELEDMIRFFDSDNDRKLDLEDFRRIVQRCHMLQTPEGS